MEDAENKERQLKAAEADFKAETAEIEKEKNEARSITEKDEKRLVELRGTAEALRSGIDVSSLSNYDRIAKHRGTGIAEARDHKHGRRLSAGQSPEPSRELDAVQHGHEVVHDHHCGIVRCCPMKSILRISKADGVVVAKFPHVCTVNGGGRRLVVNDQEPNAKIIFTDRTGHCAFPIVLETTSINCCTRKGFSTQGAPVLASV